MARVDPVSSAASTQTHPVSSGLLTVIMPVFNEADTLREALARVLDSPVSKEVIIVDDASTDGTREMLRNEIEGADSRVRILYHEANTGKGAAIRTAIPHAKGEFVIIQDADLEYDPMDFAKLLRPFVEGGATVVYGSRFLEGRVKMRLPNRIINCLLARMVRWLYGVPLSDEATCYKAFRRDLLQSIPLECKRFEFCPEVTAKVLRRGHKIVEVPIHYEARTIAQGKKIRWTDGPAAIWALIRYRFRS